MLLYTIEKEPYCFAQYNAMLDRSISQAVGETASQAINDSMIQWVNEANF